MAIPQLATQARNRQVFSVVTGLPKGFWMIWMLICVQLCELMMCIKLQELVPTQEVIIESWCQLLSYKTLMFWQSHNIQSDSRLGQLRLGVHYCFEQKAVILLISAILEDRNQWVYRYTGISVTACPVQKRRCSTRYWKLEASVMHHSQILLA